MKRWPTILLLVSLLAVTATADRRSIIVSRNNASAAGGSTYLLKQGFEITGAPCYDNGETWTESGGGVVNTNTSFVAEGSRGLALRRTAASIETLSPIFAATGDVHYFGSFATTITNAQHQLLEIRDGATPRASLYMRATGRLSIYEETQFFQASPSDAPPTNVLIYVWADWNLITGNYTLAWSLNDTKPSSGTKFATSSATAPGVTVTRLALLSVAANVTNYLDKVRLANTTIGSSPP